MNSYKYYSMLPPVNIWFYVHVSEGVNNSWSIMLEKGNQNKKKGKVWLIQAKKINSKLSVIEKQHKHGHSPKKHIKTMTNHVKY